ncbi:MAG: uracil-xanthine permease family protein [Bacilli bacterium]
MTNCTYNNLYNFEGKVPFFKALPYSLEHAFAMLISNITPILLILTNPAINNNSEVTINAIQNSLMLAGVGSLIQMFPIWKVGSKLPIFVGMNFVFMSVINYIGITYGYNAIASSVIVGSIFFIIISLLIQNLFKYIPKISSSIVVFMIGLSLIISQIETIPLMDKSFYQIPNLAILLVTVITFIVFSYGFKRKLASFALIISLICGGITSIIFKTYDFEIIKTSSVITYPKIISINNMEFNPNAIMMVCIMYLVTFTDAVGVVEMLHSETYGQDKTQQMVNTSIGIGTISILSGLFGCIPLTAYSINTGIIKKNNVINRFALSIGAILLIVLSFFPIFSSIVIALPNLIISLISIMIFITILNVGIKMLSQVKLDFKNLFIIICSIMLSIILMFITKIFKNIPALIESILSNSILISFVISIILYYLIPNKKEKREKNEKD